MNRWLQTRVFTCPRCQETYMHDRAYRHQLFQCAKRNQPPRIDRHAVQKQGE
jgi:transcription initiation factor IIE alpha subunit